MNKAKRIALLLMVALLTVGAANAQVRFGVRAGLNVDNMRMQDWKGAVNDNCGFQAGATAEVQVPLVGLCVDASLMYAYMNVSNDSKSYLDVPVNLKYKFQIPIVHIVSPYLFTGPDFAFKFNGGDTFKTFQFGWNLGVGVEIINHLQIGAGYTFGCNNIAKKVTNSIVDVKIKNNYWTISAAWFF